MKKWMMLFLAAACLMTACGEAAQPAESSSETPSTPEESKEPDTEPPTLRITKNNRE